MERQSLIRQWEEAVEALRHRDGAIAAASEQFAMQKDVLRQRKKELDAQVGRTCEEGFLLLEQC